MNAPTRTPVPVAIVEAYDRFRDAEIAWADMLEKQFGADARIARYQSRGRGEEGTALRAAWTKREDARVAFEAINPPQR